MGILVVYRESAALRVHIRFSFPFSIFSLKFLGARYSFGAADAEKAQRETSAGSNV